MRKENAQLKGQMKLFRYYFLNLWRDKQHRNAIAEKPDFRQELVQSTQALFDEVNAQGLIVEDFGAKTYYLTFMHGKLSEAANYHSAPGATPGVGLGFTPGLTPNGHTPMGSFM